MTATVWLVRHGATEWSQAGKHTGRTDIPLTAAGREAARRVAPVLASHHFALVLSSPLRRALDTAQIAGYGATTEVVDDLREWDYGEVEGRTTDEIRRQQPGWTIWRDGPPGGESLDEVAARADRVIRRLREVDGDALVFGHGHQLRVLGARWVGQAPGFAERLLLAAAAICRLGWERETPAIDRWNDTSHLDRGP